ncbi:fumarylacetoacetase [Nitrospirillum amazonense]|uniref:fumarylacetoacetase n=1 Tax=Nitrospirillum amazonense TaxID=28077 RepID=UPI002412DC14|nr:fumarylacetoacetase [Nitrospirillum amazonense]MDG3444149.1 fumarylacetoacetase [Nitrospirillum amazonense]
MNIPLIDETHNPALTSWVSSANGHADFPIQNLPLGVFSTRNEAPRGGVAIGDWVLDLAKAGRSGLLTSDALDAAIAASGPTLNPLLALGAGPRRALRRRLSQLLATGSDDQGIVEGLLYHAVDCTLHLPTAIGGYTDFYAGIHHALNVGRQFRPDNPLLPNYKHVPIGYHGRASSVRVTGTEVRRPNGQRKAPDAEAPTFGPSQRLDLELELGIWIGPGNELGTPIAIGEADSHIAGLSLLNDWSARDLQAWEYQPLGPFLAKNFLTTVSPWIITAEALAPFRTRQPARAADDPKPLPYLWDETDQERGAYGIELSVLIRTPKMREDKQPPHRLGTGPATNLYWTAAQLVAHHTCNGCDLNPGDLLGTGTISTPDDSGMGSLLELTRGGKAPITLPNGETRTFLADGDELILAGRAVADGYVSIGFGDCRGQVTPALNV